MEGASRRARLDKVASRKGPERLHRMLGRVDPESAARIMPRDRKRLVRALEVYYTTGRALTAHFGDTRVSAASAPPNCRRSQGTELTSTCVADHRHCLFVQPVTQQAQS